MSFSSDCQSTSFDDSDSSSSSSSSSSNILFTTGDILLSGQFNFNWFIKPNLEIARCTSFNATIGALVKIYERWEGEREGEKGREREREGEKGRGREVGRERGRHLISRSDSFNNSAHFEDTQVSFNKIRT